MSIKTAKKIRPVRTKFGEMSEPPQKAPTSSSTRNIAGLSLAWKGMECGWTTNPFSIRLVGTRPPHLQEPPAKKTWLAKNVVAVKFGYTKLG